MAAVVERGNRWNFAAKFVGLFSNGDRGRRSSVDRPPSSDETREWPVGVKIREMNLGDEREVRRYVDWLNFWGKNVRGEFVNNRSHFGNPPATVREAQKMFGLPGKHPLVALDEEGRIIGGAVLEDAAPNQHDHFLSLVVLDPNLQRLPTHIGTSMLFEIVDYACMHRTSDGRWRRKLDLSIIIGVSGSRTMRNITENYLRFDRVGGLRHQVDVPTPSVDREGKVVGTTIETFHTVRYEGDLNAWRFIRKLSPISDQRPTQAAS